MEWKVLKNLKDAFDLCILDVMMPYKDGYTLAKKKRKTKVPIIFLTAKSMKEDVLKATRLELMII
jgi:DNA-binding response OmpR family regulator